MPGRKKVRIAQRKKSRAHRVTLHESRLGKAAHTDYLGIAHCLTEVDVPTSPIPAARPTAPPVIKRKRPQRPISEFKHPQKKARRIAVDLERACDRVFEDHGICFDDADLPLIQSAVLKSKNGPNMLAKLILPGDQSESPTVAHFGE